MNRLSTHPTAASRHVWIVGRSPSPLAKAVQAAFSTDGIAELLPDWSTAAARLESETHLPRAILAIIETPIDWQAPLMFELAQREPLLRIIAIEGPWLSGPARRDRKPTGISRIAWHQISSISHILEESRRGSPASQLETMTDRLVAQPLVKQPPMRGLAVVHTRSKIRFEMLADIAAVCGLAAVWQLPRAGAVASGQTIEFFDDTCDFPAKVAGNRSRVLFQSFPMPQDVEAAVAGMFQLVLPLPCLTSEAASAIDRLLKQTSTKQRREAA